MDALARLALLLTFCVTGILCQSPLKKTYSQAFLDFLAEGAEDYNKEPIDQPRLLNEYDFIVVGAGTAGCVMANRLSENPDWKVLLIEAGGPENYIMDIPLLANVLQFTDVNWHHKTVPQKKSCLGMINNQCNWPRGKVMGGSSVLNYMIYTRCNRHDYDNWMLKGCTGWGYDDVLPYFKKVENYRVPGSMNETYHSQRGHLTVSEANYKTTAAKAFVEAGYQLGMPVLDYNGASQIGFSYIQSSIKNGMRDSASRSYLHPIRDRKNLHVKKNARVTKILIYPQSKLAYAVTFMHGGRKFIVRARKEIILSAGVLSSPQLLMLSGIGPKDHLNDMGIKVLQDLKVGYNLYDHIAAGGVMFTMNTNDSLNVESLLRTAGPLQNFMENRQGPFTTAGGCEAIAFYDTTRPNDPNGHPDVELLFIGGGINSYELIPGYLGLKEEINKHMYAKLGETPTFMIFPMLLLPKSRGRLMLQDSSPFTYPLIYPNYFAYKQDMATMIKAIRLATDLENTPAMRRINATLYRVPIPGCAHLRFGSDEYWACHARHLTFTIYHHVGTCKMGPAEDPEAVVDPRLRVRGINGLRVADSSILPMVPSGHTNAPVYMVAEKAADMIKQDWGYQIDAIK